MATTKIQHPTLERVVYDVSAESVPEWESAGWKVLGESDSNEDAPGDAGDVAATPTAPVDTQPLTETQGSDSPPDAPATSGAPKTTRKAV